MKWLALAIVVLVGVFLVTSPDQDPQALIISNLIRRVNDLEERVERHDGTGIPEAMEGGRFHFGLGDYLGDDILHFEVEAAVFARIEFQNNEFPKASLGGASDTGTSTAFMRADGTSDRVATLTVNGDDNDGGTWTFLTARLDASNLGATYFMSAEGNHFWDVDEGERAMALVRTDKTLTLQGNLEVGSLTSDPASPADGSIWYRSDTDVLHARINGVTQTISVGSGMSLVVKEADETVTSSTTLQDDDFLLFPVAANEIWQFEGLVIYDEAGGNGQFKVTFSGPTSSVGSWSFPTLGSTGGNALGATQNLGAAAVAEGHKFYGAIHNGANAGNLQFEWAQNSSNGTRTQVYAGSYIKFQRQ